MSTVMFVVAILGCGDAPAEPCRTERLLPARYPTAAECRAALPRVLAENSDVPWPSIGADCRRQGAQLARTEVRSSSPRP
jgi:hypothetical protein